jgi:NAD(P)-dependent dehydrogenase (short-subunit alcohol dehydrogenase family)
MAAVIDISDEASVAAGLQATRDALGHVDLLVNNAGISLPAALDGVGGAGETSDVSSAPAYAPDEMVGVRCIRRHWFFGLRERLVA